MSLQLNAKIPGVRSPGSIGDGDCRFQATPVELPICGLHLVDLATNTVIAAAVGRREVRDIVDLVTVHETILPLGAVIWAAVDKAPGFTPEGLIAEIRRNSRYSPDEWRDIVADKPVDPKAIMPRVRAILEEAEAFVVPMPTDKAGLLFLKEGRVVQPDPAHLENYETHSAQRRGHWPTNPEIAGAMLERYAPTKTPSS